ncbi:type IV secretion system protein [Enemella dayhoffiae]|uniref:type IV secretion system protein n=1 Tax=Enemella dayhoffiae TaxID=2016507 RepID=UPI0011404FB5|nr:type IV secretion system protein [Enemella dayhoffiae]
MTAPRLRKLLLGVVFAVVAVLAVLPTGTSRAAEPPECTPLPLFSANQPYAQDAASMMAVGQLFNPRDRQVEVWDTARGRPVPAYTLYEAMGMSGATWSHTKLAQQEQFKDFPPRTEYVCAYLPSALNMVANSIFDLSKLIGAGAISFRSLAANPQLVVNLLDQAAAPVNSLSTGLFLSMSVVMIMLTGLLVIFTGGMRGPGKQRETLQALIGVGIFMVIGTFLVLPSTQGGTAQSKPNYYWLTTSALNTINDANGQLSSVLLPNQTSPFCSTTSRDARRSFDCLIYQNVVLDPWATGQFGTSLNTSMPFKTDEVKRFKGPAEKLIPPPNQNGSDVRLVQLWTQGRTSTEATWGARPPGNPTDPNNDKIEERQGQWNILREVVWSQYHDQYPTWQGSNSGERVNLAFFSMLLALLVGAFLVVTSGLLLLWNSVLVALFFFLPVIALLGLFPPTQRIFRAWLMTWFKALLLSFVFQLLQTVAMLLVTAALKLPNTGMGMKAVLMVMLLLGLWKVVSLIRGDAQPVSASAAEVRAGRQEPTGVTATVTNLPAVALAGISAARNRIGGGATESGAAARAPGVNRPGSMGRTLNAPTRRKQDARVAAAVTEAEQRWVAEHGTPIDERSRVRLREEVVRSLGAEDSARASASATGPLARVPGLGSALGAGVRSSQAREEAADKLAQSQPQPGVQITNYNYFRGGPNVARASDAGPDPESAEAARAARAEAPGLGPAGAGLGPRSGKAAGASNPRMREQANEARAMEAAFQRTLTAPLDDRGMALARADHYAGQLHQAEQEFEAARRARDNANREFQLVTGRHAKKLAGDDELAAARRAARHASTGFDVATGRVRHRAHLAQVAEQAASEYR